MTPDLSGEARFTPLELALIHADRAISTLRDAAGPPVLAVFGAAVVAVAVFMAVQLLLIAFDRACLTVELWVAQLEPLPSPEVDEGQGEVAAA